MNDRVTDHVYLQMIDRIAELEEENERWRKGSAYQHEPDMYPRHVKRIEELEIELQEQSRLLGMSGEREAKLLAENKRLRGALLMIMEVTGQDSVYEEARSALGIEE